MFKGWKLIKALTGKPLPAATIFPDIDTFL